MSWSDIHRSLVDGRCPWGVTLLGDPPMVCLLSTGFFVYHGYSMPKIPPMLCFLVKSLNPFPSDRLRWALLDDCSLLPHYGLAQLAFLPCAFQTHPRPLPPLPHLPGTPRKRTRWDQDARPLPKRRRRRTPAAGAPTPAAAEPREKLPRELLPGILSWLPVKALCRFRSVCTSWRNLISSRRFVREHMERSEARKKGPHLLFWPLRRDQVSGRRLPQRRIGLFACGLGDAEADLSGFYVLPLLFETGDLTQEDDLKLTMMPLHRDGLLLFAAGSRVYACNPSTHEFLALPPSGNPAAPVTCWPTLGRDPSTGEHKVVRCFYRSYDYETQTCSLGCEVLSLASPHSWVPTADDPPYPVSREYPKFAEGAVFWTVDNGLHSLLPAPIVCLDLRDGKFSTVAPPPCVSGPDDAVGLKEMGERLCVMHSRTEARVLDIWVLKDRATGAWNKEYSIPFPRRERILLPHVSLACHRGKVFLTGLRGIYCYNPTTDVLEATIPCISRDLIYHYPPWGAFMSWPVKVNCERCFYEESLVSI